MGKLSVPGSKRRRLYSVVLSLVAASLLADCNGSQPMSATPGMSPAGRTPSTHFEGSAVSSYLYVTDPGLRAIIAFDLAGNKVAEKTFSTRHPVDVVTDSRGHVYIDLFNKGHTWVQEFSHGLDQEIAEYHPPGYTLTMTVDAENNLYLQSESAGGFEQDVVQYPYGSTRAQHTYTVVKNAPTTTTMMGISVRENILYAMVLPAPTFQINPFVLRCAVNGSSRCRDVGRSDPMDAGPCGFTISKRHQVYGAPVYQPSKAEAIEYDTLGRSWSKRHHDVDLPTGYEFGVWECRFHSYRGDVWTGVSSRSASGEVLELDVDQGKITKTIGAGSLESPNAAYYGNGFTP